MTDNTRQSVTDAVTAVSETSTSYENNILISFAVPCYNMADYIDNCVKSIIAGAVDYLNRVEIILVNDGSSRDNTPEIIDGWQTLHPDFIRAIHQQNAGHGGAVNTGLAAARGRYFKVVDADDWLDEIALKVLLNRLNSFEVMGIYPDMIISNYVYEKVHEGTSKPIRFKRVLPENRLFTWNEVGRFAPHQNLLMHTAIYRTELLHAVGLVLPEHTFYVDNIFVYVPLPAVQSLYYLNVDLYRYYIGREGQSVQESVMVGRIDQQLRITRFMIDACQLQTVESKRLRDYMSQYLLMMMTICSVFLRLSDLPDAEEQRHEIWQYLKESNPATYNHLRGSGMGLMTNLPGLGGRALAIGGYRISQKLFPFN